MCFWRPERHGADVSAAVHVEENFLSKTLHSGPVVLCFHMIVPPSHPKLKFLIENSRCNFDRGRFSVLGTETAALGAASR